MENLFQKYADIISELQADNLNLKKRVEELENTTLNNISYPKGSTLISEYYFFTKKALKERGISSFSTPGSYIILLRKTILFPFKVSLISARALKKLIVPHSLENILSLFAYEISFHSQKLIRRQVKQLDKKTKIGIFIPTLNALAGAERYTLSLTNSIKENFKNIEIDLISTNIFSAQPSLYDLPTNKEIIDKFQIDLTGVKFKYEILNYSSDYHFWRTNFKRVSKISGRYDLFINCQHNLYHTRSKKSLFICHFPHVPLSNIEIDNRLKKQIIRLYSASYDYYVGNSEFTASWLKKYWPSINEKKIGVLYPPVLTDKDRHEKIPKKENIILVCGRIDPEKKILDLAQIFVEYQHLFKGYELHIAGTTYQDVPVLKSYYEELKLLAGANSKIHLHTNIPFKELDLLYKQAKIYWHGMGYKEDVERFPVRTEHFGITVIEAMTNGCIPVVHRSGGPPKILNEIGLNTVWQSKEEAIQIILSLINNDNLADSSIKVIEASKKFSAENFNRKIIEIIKEKKLIDKKFFI